MVIQIKFLIVLLCCFIVNVMNIYEVGVLYQIVGIAIFTGVGMWSFKFEILHPFVWLSSSVFLYNISVIVLHLLDIRQTDFANEILTGIIIAISTMYIAFLVFTKVKDNKDFRILNYRYISRRWVNQLLILCMVFLSLSIVLFLKSGIATKSELSSSGGIGGFGYISKAFIFFVIFRLMIGYQEFGCLSKKLILIAISLGLVISLVIGERDIVVTLFVAVIFICYNIYKPSKKSVVIVSLIMLLCLPVLGMLKNVFSKDVTTLFDGKNLMFAVFQGEFLSSGRNFEFILSHQDQWDYFYGKSLFNDVARGTIPEFILPVENSVGWYHHKFHQDILNLGRGLGFSFLAEGFINFGYFGIVIWYIILAGFIAYLYNRSDRSVYYYIAYLFMVPLIIYSQRGDYSYIISPFLKQVIVFILIIKIGSYIYPQKSIAK